ncbi:winged helix-turn-helix domain-containing protein [Streptomyces fagopyri]|uniref:helix-turn-helix domain-containing protein n=1 Tax=Streptomyces fagopyri TaxID=2662397 RepID=UPI0036BC9DF2
MHGWEDQRWTLERVQALIGLRFKVSCSVAGVWWLLHRHGWSWRCPARRALERDARSRSRGSAGARRSTAAGGERPRRRRAWSPSARWRRSSGRRASR